MKWFKLSPEQAKRFGELKSDQELQVHGPLADGQVVPIHDHSDQALYLVKGIAVCRTGDPTKDQILGLGREFNAVLVEPGDRHGWMALIANTVIEHCFGNACETVLATT